MRSYFWANTLESSKPLLKPLIYIYIHTHTHRFLRNLFLKYTQGVSGGIVNILGGGSMDYSE